VEDEKEVIEKKDIKETKKGVAPLDKTITMYYI